MSTECSECRKDISDQDYVMVIGEGGHHWPHCKECADALSKNPAMYIYGPISFPDANIGQNFWTEHMAYDEVSFKCEAFQLERQARFYGPHRHARADAFCALIDALTKSTLCGKVQTETTTGDEKC